MHAAGNGRDLRHVLKTIKVASSIADLPGPAKGFVKKVAAKAKCSESVAMAALAKTTVADDLPKLQDVEHRLVDTLAGVWERASDSSLETARRAARNLASECGRASSLVHLDVLPAYLPVTADPIGTELAARIDAKRIDRSRLIRILDQGANETAPLEGDIESIAGPGSGQTDLLVTKIDAGGFSVVSRNSAIDLRSKADYLGISWTKKYGRERGLQRYGHIRSLVLSDAGRAFENASRSGEPFGVLMLSDLRARFRDRRAQGELLYECSDEHLEGVAYSLTAECQVQWSLDRPWEVE